MKTYLVTGAAGFIGANYLKYILAKHDDIRVVVLDLLTYAGYLGTIAGDIDNERCYFVKGDICDRGLLDRLFAEYRFDVVVNFAAESHVDRSIENPQLFLNTNILGTQNLLDAARAAWVMGRGTGLSHVAPGCALPSGVNRRGVWLTWGRGLLYRRHTALSAQPLQCIKNIGRPLCLCLSRHLPHAGEHHALLKQLWSLPIS